MQRVGGWARRARMSEGYMKCQQVYQYFGIIDYWMQTLKKGKFQEYKASSNTMFVVKPSAPNSIRHNSKDSKQVSPLKNTIKVKYYTQSKPTTITEGVELAIGSMMKRSNQRWSQQKQLPIIKSGRDSQKKVPTRPQFAYGKKRGKNEEINTESSEKNKTKEKREKAVEYNPGDDSRKRKFKSMDAYRQVDDEEGDLIVFAHDNIGGRYEVLSAIGRGTFGQVFKAYDHKMKEYVALKIIKNDQKFTTQARVEVKILRAITDQDTHKKSNIIEIKDSFLYKNHMCIAFELLHISLYDFLKEHSFTGFSLDLIRRIAIQVLQALLFLQKKDIVHCDLKPENILLKQANKSGVKVIDLGSSCFISERIYNYIQSRFYRAPEIILGIPYTPAIDMWSFGCILAELSSGQALFPGSNEMEQMDRFSELLGLPPKNVIDHAPRKRKFYDDDIFKGKRKAGSKTLQEAVSSDDKDFLALIRLCLQWDPEKRIKPAEALLNKWIIDALPEDIKLHHVNQIKAEQPTLFD